MPRCGSWSPLREALDTGYAVREGGRLAQAVAAILDGYLRGTRYGIGVDADGLLRAGEPGVQLTWMDAKLGDWVVTPASANR
jgi:glycogen debranching enzyme